MGILYVVGTDGARRMTVALRNREFRALWAAEAQSIAGDQLAKVTLAILVYSRTGSALWAAGVYALTFLPALAGGLGLAQLADRYPRRTLLVLSAAAQAVLVGLMAIPGMPLAALCVLVVFVGLVGALVNAAQHSLTRDVFTDDEVYLRSQDLRGITMNLVMLVGLAGGGVLVTLVGTSVALAIDAVTFAVSAVVIRCCVRRRARVGAGNGRWFGGARWLFGRPPTRVLLGLSWLVGLTVVPEGLAAPLAAELGAPASAVGWLLAADPVGFIAGTFLLSRYVSAQQRRRVMAVLAVAASATLMVFYTEPSLALALLLLTLAGAFGAYVITVGATLMTWVPNDIRGGVAGVYRTGLRVAQGIGVALGGLVAELAGSATTAIALAGTAGVLAAGLLAYRWVRLRAGNVGISSEVAVAHGGTSNP